MNFLCNDHPQEECGLIGIFAPNEDVARMAYFGLFALQHRGQEAAGIAVSDGVTMSMHKNIGLIAQVFSPNSLESLTGKYAIGHTRYSTTGSSSTRNAQPFMIETLHGPLALGHNGNLVNSAELRQKLLEGGVGLSASSDSEVLTMMLARAQGDTWEERIKDCMQVWLGAYSLVLLTRAGVYAARDPWGFRPLSVGLLPGGGYAAASETGALRTLGCQAIREVQPGEIVSLRNGALVVTQALEPAKPLARCIFELIYFSRPDAVWDGRSIHQVRQNLGRELRREKIVEADVVIPVPDLSVPAAIGYAAEFGYPLQRRLHQESLCWADVYRTDRLTPQTWGGFEIQCGQRKRFRKACITGGRFDRARQYDGSAYKTSAGGRSCASTPGDHMPADRPPLLYGRGYGNISGFDRS